MLGKALKAFYWQTVEEGVSLQLGGIGFVVLEGQIEVMEARLRQAPTASTTQRLRWCEIRPGFAWVCMWQWESYKRTLSTLPATNLGS